MQDGPSDTGRKLGPCLSEDPRVITRKMEYVKLYRACLATTKAFNDMDYCTLSRQFAEGHADHGATVDEEPYHVLEAVVPVGWVFEAYNPGEYFFHPRSGRPTRGRIIYTAEPE